MEERWENTILVLLLPLRGLLGIPVLWWSSYGRGEKQMRCEPSVQVKMRGQFLGVGAWDVAV